MQSLGTIQIHTIRLYAYHGCLPEERKIGSDYTVDLKVKADLQKAAKSDRLEDTVDYVEMHRIVHEEMGSPSDLLEHVSKRIIDRILGEMPSIKKVEITVAKCNPPIMGDVKSVSVTLSAKR